MQISRVSYQKEFIQQHFNVQRFKSKANTVSSFSFTGENPSINASPIIDAYQEISRDFFESDHLYFTSLPALAIYL